MTDIDDYTDDLDDGYEDDPDDWDYRDDDHPEHDPEDWEQAKAYAEYAEHCEAKHGGGECDCRPSRILAARTMLGDATRRAVWSIQRAWFAAVRRPHFLRLGRLEFSVRFRRPCGACSSRGWNHSKGGLNSHPAPPGYDGVGLCPCGSAIGSLADSAAYLRADRRRSRTEPPF